MAINMIKAPKAIRIAGSNSLDNLQIDLLASYALQEKWLSDISKKSVLNNIIANHNKYLIYKILKRLRLYEPLILNNIIHYWFDEFLDYWLNSLQGRPINIFDFQMIMYDYRKRFHSKTKRNWDSNSQHIANYQSPENLFLTFYFVLREALYPERNHFLLPLLKDGMRVLEFGCSIAPMYRTWRTFGSHKRCNWVLADIPNYPFHYARHIYAQDFEATTCLITEEFFDDPLNSIDGDFDIIIIQEVFEHLHKPLHIANYLYNRLKYRGLLFFDYVISDATGLDTLAGLEERAETLAFLFNRLTPMKGDWDIYSKSIGLCVGCKR